MIGPRPLLRRLVSVALLAGLTSMARADSMRLTYSGVVTSAGARTGLAPGDPFSGTITYRVPGPQASRIFIPGSTQYFDWPLDVSTGPWAPAGPGAAFSLQVGKSWSVDGHAALSFGTQQGDLNSSCTIPPGVLYFATSAFDVSLKNSERVLFGDANIPTPTPTSINLSDFTSATLSYRGDLHYGFEEGFAGAINSVSLLALPSPTSVDPGTVLTPPHAEPSPTVPAAEALGPPAITPEPSPLATLGIAAMCLAWRRVRSERHYREV